MVSLLKRTTHKLDLENHLLILDWEDDRKMADEFKVFGIPTLLILENNKILERVSGMISEQELERLVAKYRK